MSNVAVVESTTSSTNQQVSESTDLLGWDKDAEIRWLRTENANLTRELDRLRSVVSKLQTQHVAEASSFASFSFSSFLIVFAYGSLIWNPGSIPFVAKRVGVVRGWKRLFAQKSTDHRGTPAAPGRVVTLVKSTASELDCCEGVVYVVPKEEAERVEAYLDYREKDGYDKVSV